MNKLKIKEECGIKPVEVEIKTLEGWDIFFNNTKKGYWGDYCKPEELVSEEVFEHFANSLPPRNCTSGYLQMGEPHNHVVNPKTGRLQATYMTFCIAGGSIYRYCGNCFAGEMEDIK